MSGGDTLPAPARAMRAADRSTGAAAPHVHPRIEAGGARAAARAGRLRHAGRRRRPRAGLLIARWTGWSRDLRAMGATNVLCRAPALLGKAGASRGARALSRDAGNGDRTVETFEILHFAAWTPQQELKAPLTMSRGRVVNPGGVNLPRGRGPEEGGVSAIRTNVAQASRRPARSDCDRIWADCRADRRCDDGGPAVAGRRRRRHVGQDLGNSTNAYMPLIGAVSSAASRRRPA